jgi:hypothetical protein
LILASFRFAASERLGTYFDLRFSMKGIDSLVDHS